jgi:hypothetical protein
MSESMCKQCGFPADEHSDDGTEVFADGFGLITHERAIALGRPYSVFLGPCAHGRDPYDRCDICDELGPVIAKRLAENPALDPNPNCAEPWLCLCHAALREEARR